MKAATEPSGRRGASGPLIRYGTIAVALLLIAVSGAAIIAALGFPSSSTLGAPGPARLPIAYGATLIALSLGIVFTVLFGRPEAEVSIHRSVHLLALLAWTVLYIALLPKVGFLLLSIPWLFVSVLYLGTSWLTSLITAIALPAAVYVSFGMLLGIPLP